MTERSISYRGRVKYDARQSQKYQRRKPRKHQAEMRLIERAFALIPKPCSVLDVPCGGGRVMLHLARLGYTVSGADLSEPMLAIARANVAQAGLSCPVEQQDVEKLTYPDGRFDAVVCFRLFHHFPSTGIRQRVVNELCRVARRSVALSYFSPYSVQSVRRKLSGRDTDRFSMSLGEIAGYFAAAGFRLVKDLAQMPLVHTLHLAVFERVPGREPAVHARATK
ncbi:MAG TPA: class I SAM-dependent methyltransferase [Verrucomicrobiae bacterium]|nr:class I SAM-dependent methyltransferase [Verrucomicrobiae bacterium]